MNELNIMRPYNPKLFKRTTMDHKQKFITHDGLAYKIDTKLISFLKAAWEIGIKTRFSCQHSLTKIDNNEPYFQLAFETAEDFKHFLSVVSENFSEKSKLYQNLWGCTLTTPWVYDVTVFIHEKFNNQIEMMYFIYIPVRDKNALVAKFRKIKNKNDANTLKTMLRCAFSTSQNYGG